jgi:hypothetical protein
MHRVQTVAVDDNVAVETLAVGQYVELYPTIPSKTGGSTLRGTRGIVDAVTSLRFSAARSAPESEPG